MRRLTKLNARRKLLGILPRARLEDLSEMPNPYNADRFFLMAACLKIWEINPESVSAEVEELIKDIVTVAGRRREDE